MTDIKKSTPHENIKDRAGYPLSHTCIFKKCIHIEVGHFMKKMYEEERFYHPTKTYIGKANIVFKGAIYSIYLMYIYNSLGNFCTHILKDDLIVKHIFYD